MPRKPVQSLKHKHATRAHTPSTEEAGYEDANAKVLAAAKASFPRNPVVHRGQDPELFWLGKYGPEGDAGQDAAPLEVDIRSLYRHEHIAPETLIESLYKVVEEKPAVVQDELFSVNELFGNALDHDELDKVSDYYTHPDGWTNRLVQADSLLLMTSLLEREGMAGQVQCIFFDPPYGIKYGSNWQIKLTDRTVTDGKDDHLTGEPEQIKAYRDTWELGIHSYLSYLRDRLLVAKQLLHTSGSIFVQISDENVHLVRCLLDEVFGSENFVSLIAFAKTSSSTQDFVSSTTDYLLYYARDKERLKYRQLYTEKNATKDFSGPYQMLDLPDGTRRRMTMEEKRDPALIPPGAKIFRLDNLQSQSIGREKGEGAACWFPVKYAGKEWLPNSKSRWKTNEKGMAALLDAKRLEATKSGLYYVRYLEDFPVQPISNLWQDTVIAGFTSDKAYVVETSTKVIERCLLMSTDPGDLVLDPTCGSGTTAFTAENWGRRWITCDTSRIALNIAKTRLMTSVFPYYKLHDERGHDLRQGFVYKTVPHVTLRSLAYRESAPEETLYDQPEEDKKRLRVSGPFTVETLQSYEPVSPEELARQRDSEEDLAAFEDLIFDHLKSAGVKTGDKKENAVFVRVDRLASPAIHAEGFYPAAGGEKKAYLHIGPKFGTVSKRSVEEAVKECRQRGDADWLIILGFSFDSAIESREETFSMGKFQVSRVRMHDDLLQAGLLKKDKKAASFVTIGEPDIKVHRAKDGTATVEIRGLDIYDPIRDVVKSRDVHDIAYWMLDHDYDGSNFVVRQVFFCGGEKDEFDKWRKGLDRLAKDTARKKAEKTLRVEIDEDAFANLYSHTSNPFPAKPGQKLAIRVISQFGEETTKVLSV